MTAFEGSSSGVFQPEELSAIKHVFEEITSEPWFSRDPSAKKSFAEYLIDTYRNRTFDPARDRPMVIDVARAHFRRGR